MSIRYSIYQIELHFDMLDERSKQKEGTVLNAVSKNIDENIYHNIVYEMIDDENVSIKNNIY